MSTRIITLAFVQPAPEDHWLNRLTGMASQHNVCHVELHFETINQCFSIQYGENAGLRPKSMGNPNYKIISLTVSRQEYDNCLTFAQTASTWNLRFDDGGMYKSYFRLSCCGRSSQDSGKTFCSKIITEALQFGGLPEVEWMNPCTTTPSRLYEAIRKSQRAVCASVPYKRGALAACGSIPMVNMAK